MRKALGIAILAAAYPSQVLPVASSLVEAAGPVAVGTVLAGVAVGGAIDMINDSKVQAAIADVSAIGKGMQAFYQANKFPPLYRYGNMTASTDAFFFQLVSENGAYPADGTPGRNWGVPASPTAWQQPMFGHKPESIHDTIEGQLVRNQLGGDFSQRYPLRGSYPGDPQRGWAGPYVAMLPKTDPWGNKYMVKMRSVDMSRTAIFVLSAGANRTIETNAEQLPTAFLVVGDDIVFRVR